MVEVTLDPERGYRPLRNEKPRMGVRGVVWEGVNGLLGGYFSEQGSEGERGGCWDDSIPKQSELIRSIVTGDAQLGIVQPTGSPIKVSTQRGLSLPHPIALASASGNIFASFSRFPAPPASPVGPPVTPADAGVGHVLIWLCSVSGFPLCAPESCSALGVAQLFTCWSNLSVMLPSFCLCAPVETVAVCHCFSTTWT